MEQHKFDTSSAQNLLNIGIFAHVDADNVHPNGLGFDYMARAILPAVREALAKAEA